MIEEMLAGCTGAATAQFHESITTMLGKVKNMLKLKPQKAASKK